MPGVQYPHCTAPSATNAACTGCRASPSASASTVVTARPIAAVAGVTQARTGSPSRSTVQAPHTPSPQPGLAPVRPSSSRRNQSSDRSSPGRILASRPFTCATCAEVDGPGEESVRAIPAHPIVGRGGSPGRWAARMPAAELTRRAERAVREGGVAGAAVLVATPAGRTVAAAGLADHERGTPMRGDERIRVGSITKPFTAALILLLADEGRLRLDAPVDRWLEGFPDPAGITIHRLLTHTSGLASDTDDPRVPLARFEGAPLPPAELLAIGAGGERAFRPGERF